MQGGADGLAAPVNMTLEPAYERGDLLEDVRVLRRFLKSLRNNPLFEHELIQEWYWKYSKKLARAQERLDELFPPSAPPRLDLVSVYDHHNEFRFSPVDLDLLARYLLPAGNVVFRNDTGIAQVKATSLVALCVVLRHLASPEKISRQATFWARSTGWVSQVYHATLDLLYAVAVRVLVVYDQCRCSALTLFALADAPLRGLAGVPLAQRATLLRWHVVSQ